MAVVNVYIDGFNLYYGALKRTPYKWLDLAKLAQTLLPSDAVQEISYFTARVSARPLNPTATHDQSIYIRALKTIPNLRITYGHFLTHSVPMYLTNVIPPQRVWVDKTEEKGSDVNIASHLLRDAYQRRFEVAVLVTNDSDLAEPVRIIAQEVGLPVGILNPHQFHSRSLRQYATFMKRIRQGDLAVSQFPGKITDRKGSFTKPQGW
ncbi:MAG TPA: NYN domain-containing protein [Acidobacteriaceae bacterium]